MAHFLASRLTDRFREDANRYRHDDVFACTQLRHKRLKRHKGATTRGFWRFPRLWRNVVRSDLAFTRVSRRSHQQGGQEQ